MDETLAKLIVHADETKETFALHDYLEENGPQEYFDFLVERKTLPDLYGAKQIIYGPREEYYTSLSLKTFLRKYKNVTPGEWHYFHRRVGSYKHRILLYHFHPDSYNSFRSFCLNNQGRKKANQKHLQMCNLIVKHFCSQGDKQMKHLAKDINKRYDDLRWQK